MKKGWGGTIKHKRRKARDSNKSQIGRKWTRTDYKTQTKTRNNSRRRQVPSIDCSAL